MAEGMEEQRERKGAEEHAPHSFVPTEQLLPYASVPPGRVPSLCTSAMVTVRPRDQGLAMMPSWPGQEGKNTTRAREAWKEESWAWNQAPEKPAVSSSSHPGKEPDSSVLQISVPELPGPTRLTSAHPSDFPSWPNRGDRNKGTMACPGNQTPMTWLSHQWRVRTRNTRVRHMGRQGVGRARPDLLPILAPPPEV